MRSPHRILGSAYLCTIAAIVLLAFVVGLLSP